MNTWCTATGDSPSFTTLFSFPRPPLPEDRTLSAATKSLNLVEIEASVFVGCIKVCAACNLRRVSQTYHRYPLSRMLHKVEGLGWSRRSDHQPDSVLAATSTTHFQGAFRHR
jgi:hypothetical protein